MWAMSNFSGNSFLNKNTKKYTMQKHTITWFIFFSKMTCGLRFNVFLPYWTLFFSQGFDCASLGRSRVNVDSDFWKIPLCNRKAGRCLFLLNKWESRESSAGLRGLGVGQCHPLTSGFDGSRARLGMKCLHSSTTWLQREGSSQTGCNWF